MPKLTDDTITSELPRLPGWARKGDTIVKTFSFADFIRAIAFVNQLAQHAEDVDHHPDIDIRFNKVSVSFSTHDAGGITQNDLDSVAAANTLAANPL